MNPDEYFEIRTVPPGPVAQKRGLTEQFEVWNLKENCRVFLSTSFSREVAQQRIDIYMGNLVRKNQGQ